MSKKQPLGNFVQVLYARRKLLIPITILLGIIAVFAQLYPFEGIGEWTGIGKDSNESETIEAELNPKKNNEITKITYKKTENFQSSKTLWDFLGLAGTIAIPFVLLYFERTQQRRSLQQAENEKKIADNNLREQALEAYFDKMSELLIDKQLKVLIGKTLEESDPEYSVLDAALNIVRVRTLSVLRRLDQDGERKGNVIRFLIDSELLSNLDLNSADLSLANLSGAKLYNANLSGANLEGANLKDAKLSHTNFSGANLSRTDLSRTDLSHTNFSDANLSGANLEGANLLLAVLSNFYIRGDNLEGINLSGANLEGANLKDAKLSDANLKDAKLSGANLKGANFTHAKNLTVEQIKAAKNWQQAKYDPNFAPY